MAGRRRPGMKFRITILLRCVGADCSTTYFSFIRKTVVHSKEVNISCKTLRKCRYCVERGIDNHNQYPYLEGCNCMLAGRAISLIAVIGDVLPCVHQDEAHRRSTNEIANTSGLHHGYRLFERS